MAGRDAEELGRAWRGCANQRIELAVEVGDLVVECVDAAGDGLQRELGGLAGRGELVERLADIRELGETAPFELAFGDRVAQWTALSAVHTPLIAAVSGHCLAGLRAGDGLRHHRGLGNRHLRPARDCGRPDPGRGRHPRLLRAIGKAKAMDVVLAGRTLTAAEADLAGLVSRVAAREDYLREAMDVARAIAASPDRAAPRQGGDRPRSRHRTRRWPRVRTQVVLSRVPVRGCARGARCVRGAAEAAVVVGVTHAASRGRLLPLSLDPPGVGVGLSGAGTRMKE